MTDTLYRTPSQVFSRTDAEDFSFIDDGKSVRTWSEFSRAANGWKSAYEAAGVHRVAIYFTELFDSAAALFGAWAAGVTAILPADTSEASCQRLAAGVAEACVGDFSNNMPLPKIRATTSDTPCTVLLDEKAELIELFTSGSTGTPTRVVKRLEQLFLEIDNIHGNSGRRATSDTLVISTVSQQHIYGLLYFLLWPIAAGLSAWPRRITQPQELFEAVLTRKHCAWVASPALLKRLPESPEWERIRFRWQMIFSSGGPLPVDGLKRTLSLTGVSPTELFGSSESGGIAIRNQHLDAEGRVIDSEWHPLPSVQWRSENGVLAIRSRQLHSSGWELTSDRIEVCPDGRSFIHLGRADRIVKINEKRVSLAAVENALTTTQLVACAKAIQLEDDRRSLAIAAVLTKSGIDCLRGEGKFALVQKLKTELSRSFERVCLPRRWRFVTALPENTMGKTTTASVAALFTPEALQSVCAEKTDSTAVFVVCLPADLPFFEGHFPGFAILPGLTQIQWAVELVRTAFNLPEHFAGLSNLKFMKPVRPGTTVEYALTLSEDKLSAAFILSSAGNVHAKGKLLFSNEVPA